MKKSKKYDKWFFINMVVIFTVFVINITTLYFFLKNFPKPHYPSLLLAFFYYVCLAYICYKTSYKIPNKEKELKQRLRGDI